MAVDPNSLTVDFRQLLRMTVRDRASFARSPDGPSFLSSLTPIQLAQLFPGHWRNIISVPGAAGGGGGGGGGISAPAGTFTSGGTATGLPTGAAPAGMPSTGTPSAAPQTSTEYVPSWYKRYMGAQAETGAAVSGALPKDTTPPANVLKAGRKGNVDRSMFHNELKDPEVRKLFATMMEAEVGSQGRKAQQAFAETVFNRAYYQGWTLKQILEKKGIPKKEYYEPYKNGRFEKVQKMMNEKLLAERLSIIDEVGFGGTDLTKGASHNASAGVAASVNRGGYDADTSSIVYIDGETYYRKTFKNERKPLPRITEDATKVLPQDASKTGQVMPEPGLRPEGAPFDVIDKNQINKINAGRAGYFRGKVFFDDGSEGFDYGTGGRNRGSIPYGTHELRPGLWEHSSIKSFRNNSFYVKDMFDPKVADMRRGILIHSASDMDKLYSSGCVAVHRSQWKAFKAKMMEYQKINEGKPIYISVDPTTNNVTITTKMPEGGGVAVGGVMKELGTSTTQRQGTQYQPPPGFDKLPEDLRKEIDNLPQNRRNALFAKMREDSEQGVDPIQGLTKSYQESPQETVAKVTEATATKEKASGLIESNALRVGDTATILSKSNGIPMSGVDERLKVVGDAAIRAFEAQNPGYKVKVISGYRKGDRRKHGKGHAIDYAIIGPDGKSLPNLGDPKHPSGLGVGARAGDYAPEYMELMRYMEAARVHKAKSDPKYAEMGTISSGMFFQSGAWMDSMHASMGEGQRLGNLYSGFKSPEELRKQGASREVIEAVERAMESGARKGRRLGTGSMTQEEMADLAQVLYETGVQPQTVLEEALPTPSQQAIGVPEQDPSITGTVEQTGLRPEDSMQPAPTPSAPTATPVSEAPMPTGLRPEDSMQPAPTPSAPTATPVSEAPMPTFDIDADPLEGFDRGEVPLNAFDGLKKKERQALRVKFASDPSKAEEFVQKYADRPSIPFYGKVNPNPEMIAGKIRENPDFQKHFEMSEEDQAKTIQTSVDKINADLAAKEKIRREQEAAAQQQAMPTTPSAEAISPQTPGPETQTGNVEQTGPRTVIRGPTIPGTSTKTQTSPSTQAPAAKAAPATTTSAPTATPTEQAPAAKAAPATTTSAPTATPAPEAKPSEEFKANVVDEQKPKMKQGGEVSLTGKGASIVDNETGLNLGTFGEEGSQEVLKVADGGRLQALPTHINDSDASRDIAENKINQQYEQADRKQQQNNVENQSSASMSSSSVPPNKRFLERENMNVGDPLNSGSVRRAVCENAMKRDDSKFMPRPGLNFTRLA